MYHGIIPALLTPFTPDRQVDGLSLCALIDYLISQRVDGLYICGSTGEGLLLSEAERRLVAETTVRHAAGRVPIIVHVGVLDTLSAERLARHAGEIGADAIASIPPFYYPAGVESIETYYRQVSAAGGIPMIMYNIPAATGVQLTVDLIRRLFEDGVVSGLKHTSYDQLMFREMIETCGPNFNVMAGPDEMLLSFLVMGAHGGIGTTYNCAPWLYREIYDAWRRGDIAEAQRLQFQADRIILALRPFGVIAATKAATGFMGIECGDPRPPILPLSAERKEELREVLRSVGFFEMQRDRRSP